MSKLGGCHELSAEKRMIANLASSTQICELQVSFIFPARKKTSLDEIG